MEIRLRSTGQVMLESELRQWAKDNNGPSWGVTTPEVLEALGVDPVFEGPQASGGTIYQYSQRQGVEQVGGKWYTKHILGPVFVDGDTTAAEQEAAYKAMKDAEFAKSARDSRDTLLSECDWVVVMSLEAGRAIPTDLATYRQALRDIPQQAGFPVTINWPVKP
jgi:hypothetical protein